MKIGTKISSFVVVVAGVLGYWASGQMVSGVEDQLENDLPQLLQQMVQTVRLADSCQKVVGVKPASLSLQCVVEFNPGVPERVDFYQEAGSNQIQYREWNGVVWLVGQTFGSPSSYAITSFILCDTNDMTGTEPSCSLQPKALSSSFVAFENGNRAHPHGVDLTNRFFRVQIHAAVSPTAPARLYQTASFVRNPTPTPAGTSGVTYQWGVRR